MVIHIVKGIGIIDKAEIDVFLKLSCFSNGGFLLILSVNFWGKHVLIYHLELWKQNLVKGITRFFGIWNNYQIILELQEDPVNQS